ncbi:MAG: hypothetical protein KBE65_02700 [Phycisphaerae bacterium]|nr:hypothetical protein [Phycisphaerae bacterium]
MPGALGIVLGDDLNKRALLSHWIRTQCESKKNTDWVLSYQLVDSIIENPRRPSPAEQADNFIRWIGDNSKTFDEYVDVEKFAIQAIVGSATFDEFVFVFGHLRDKGVIQHQGGRDNIYSKARLSFLGWERYRELSRATSDSRKAFMAMQYDNEQLTTIFTGVFKEAVEKTGFDLRRLVDMPQPAGLIDDDLRVKIRASRFLIADLTDKNPGAYWEAGYAEGLGKRVIYTCKKEVFEDPNSRPHFDTNHHLTILWEWDPDKRKEAGEKLKNTIRATLPAEAKLSDD